MARETQSTVTKFHCSSPLKGNRKGDRHRFAGVQCRQARRHFQESVEACVTGRVSCNTVSHNHGGAIERCVQARRAAQQLFTLEFAFFIAIAKGLTRVQVLFSDVARTASGNERSRNVVPVF